VLGIIYILNILNMKRLAILALVLITSLVVLSSCQSHGPKCPGMYSQVETNTNQAQ